MRLELLAYPLVFRSGIHLGTREGALEGTEHYIHSDTLYSAFFHGWRLLYGIEDLTRLLGLILQGDPPFLFSSAFPFWEGEKYLPVPKNQLPRDKDEKKIQYLESTSWGHLVKGEELSKLLEGKNLKTIPRSLGPAVPEGEEYPWKILELPRVGLDRRFNHPEDRYFHCSEVHFNKDAGLFFLAKVQDDSYLDKINAVWGLLADEGLGGDRSVGKGFFKHPKPEIILLEVPEEKTGEVTLSLYYPRENELLAVRQAYYDLIERKGYVFSPEGRSLRRKASMMFLEGSVFPTPPEHLGHLLDVTPTAFTAHKVYRTGLFFGIPCYQNGREQ